MAQRLSCLPSTTRCVAKKITWFAQTSDRPVSADQTKLCGPVFPETVQLVIAFVSCCSNSFDVLRFAIQLRRIGRLHKANKAHDHTLAK